MPEISRFFGIVIKMFFFARSARTYPIWRRRET